MAMETLLPRREERKRLQCTARRRQLNFLTNTDFDGAGTPKKNRKLATDMRGTTKKSL
jgi:hypothetical protein